MFKVRPPMSTARPTSFSTPLSRQAPPCSYVPAEKSASATTRTTTLATKPASRRNSLHAPLSGMGTPSLQPQKQPRSNQGGRPNQKDHARADRFWHRERRQDEHDAADHDQVSRMSVRPDPAGTVRQRSLRADANREVGASPGKEVSDADQR